MNLSSSCVPRGEPSPRAFDLAARTSARYHWHTSRLQRAGSRGFIIIDPPPEEGEEFFSLCDEFGLSFVPLAGTAHARDPRQSRPPRASCCSRRTPVASAFSSMRIPDNYTLLLFVIRNSNTTPRVESVSRSEEIL